MTAHFFLIDDFNAASWKPNCPVTGLGKQKQPHNEPPKQPHEIDQFILRGPEILFHDGRGERSLGFIDVRPDAIRIAASTYLGMVDGDQYRKVLAHSAGHKAANEALTVENDSLRDQLRAMILGNAELIVQNEAVTQELEAAYTELYPDRDNYSDTDDMLDQDDIESLDALQEAELS